MSQINLKEAKNLQDLIKFLPFVYHFKDNSILTTNGDVIIVIKLQYGKKTDDEISFKNQFKKACAEIDFSKFALWVTTIRSKEERLFSELVNLKKENEFNLIGDSLLDYDPFVEQYFDYSNELYISIIINDDIDLSTTKTNINPFININKNKYLEEANETYHKCSQIANQFLEKLADFNPHTLSLYKHNKKYYSEILTFFSRIGFINETNAIYLPSHNLASELVIDSYKKITTLYDYVHLKPINEGDFKKNTIDTSVNIKKKKSYYVALFEIKEKVNAKISDALTKTLLKQDFKLISTEILIFLDETLNVFKGELREEKDTVNEQKKIIANTSDNNSITKEISDLSEKRIDKILLNKKIILRKNIISIVSESYDKLSLDSYTLYNVFNFNNINMYRHNTFSEEVFWSQLPGNFSFLSKLKVTDIDTILTFNNFNNVPSTWRDFMVFKNKFTDLALKIDLENKYIILFEGDKYIINQFFCYLSVLTLKFSEKVYYFDISFSLKKLQSYLKKSDQSIGIKIKLQKDNLISLIDNMFSILESINGKKALDSSGMIRKNLFADNYTVNIFNLIRDISNNDKINKVLNDALLFDSINLFNVAALSAEEFLSILIITIFFAIINSDLIEDVLIIRNISSFIKTEDHFKILSRILNIAYDNKIYCLCDLTNVEVHNINSVKNNFEQREIVIFNAGEETRDILEQNLKGQDFDQRFFENLLVIINDSKLFVTDLDLKNFIDKNKDFFEL